MAFSVSVLRGCFVAGLLGLAVEARAQSLEPMPEDGSTTSADVETATDLPAPPPLLPRLTIAPEEPAVQLARPPKRVISNDPTGLPTGGLRLFPALEISNIYSSNVKQSSDDRKAALGVSVTPSLRVESDWVRHSLRATLQGNYTAYAKSKDANTASVNANSELRLDIRRTTSVDLSTGYTLSPVRPDDTGLAGGSTGTRLDHVLSAAVGFNQDLGPLTARLRTDVERKIYGKDELVGGGERDNKDLNLWRPGVGLRLTYSEPPMFKPYIEANYSRRYHDRKLNSSGENTNSGDIDLRLGTSFDDEAFWAGDLALTYLRRDYSDKSLSKEQAFGVNGNITWRPTELTTIAVDASTSLSDTAINQRTYSLNARVSQSVRDNVTLQMRGGVTVDDTSTGLDKTYEAGVGLDWRVAPEFSLTADYDATWLRASQSQQNYTEHRVMVGVTLRR